MLIREATINDIRQIQEVRNSVKENVLSDPKLVTDDDCKEFITVRGKGWVCEVNYIIIGFAIFDLRNRNVWALFINPMYEKQGIGRKLHNIMLDWYFTHTKETIWLSTDPNTRAEEFYRRAGWKETGIQSNGEIRFEMSYDDWFKKSTLLI